MQRLTISSTGTDLALCEQMLTILPLVVTTASVVGGPRTCVRLLPGHAARAPHVRLGALDQDDGRSLRGQLAHKTLQKTAAAEAQLEGLRRQGYLARSKPVFGEFTGGPLSRQSGMHTRREPPTASRGRLAQGERHLGLSELSMGRVRQRGVSAEAEAERAALLVQEAEAEAEAALAARSHIAATDTEAMEAAKKTASSAAALAARFVEDQVGALREQLDALREVHTRIEKAAARRNLDAAGAELRAHDARKVADEEAARLKAAAEEVESMAAREEEEAARVLMEGLLSTGDDGGGAAPPKARAAEAARRAPPPITWQSGARASATNPSGSLAARGKLRSLATRAAALEKEAKHLESQASGEAYERNVQRRELEAVERKMAEIIEVIERQLTKADEFKRGRAMEAEAEVFREALAASLRSGPHATS